ncbi:MAG: dihydrodipicolinate synthase family protein [Pseudomonadota bacterium]
MAVSICPRGLIIDLITPLNPNGDIDGRGLGRHLDRVLPQVQALLLASPHMGEGRNLTAHQRVELLEKAIVVTRGEVPILVWITCETPEETRETLLLLAEKSKARKYSGPVFWVDTPLYYHSNRGLLQYYDRLAAETEAPWILCNDPDLIKKLSRPLKRNNLRTSILKDIAHINKVQGMIYLGSPDRARNYAKAVRSRPEFRIYDGDESYFLRHPSLSGVVSAGANLAPKAWQKITNSSLNLTGDRPDYPDHLRQIWEAGEYLQELMGLYQAQPVPLVKKILADMGIIESPATHEKGEVPEKTVSALTAVMRNHGDYS